MSVILFDMFFIFPSTEDNKFLTTPITFTQFIVHPRTFAMAGKPLFNVEAAFLLRVH